MKTTTICLLSALSFLAPLCFAKPPLDVIGDDDASKTDYGSGWSEGKNGGDGFGKWALRTVAGDGEHSHAGFYIANTGDKQDLNGVAMRGKAFGMYANGTGFEAATAFRAFDRALKVGQSFSFLMEHGEIVKKFDTDDSSGGSIGMTLRASTDANGVEDYNKEARFEFGYYKSDSGAGYQIFDGDGNRKLDVPFTDSGLAVTFTLVTADTYNLEITVLSSKTTSKVDGRKLGGSAGGPIAGLALFDRNGETNDAYFNGFQILQAAQ